MRRRWPKIVLRGPEDSRRLAQDALLVRGSIGAWEDAAFTALYFPPEFSVAEVRDLTEVALSAAGAGDVSWALEWEEEQDWMSGWRKFFRPLAVGRRIIVKPPWGEIPSEWVDRDVVIQIEPKMAFGTGTHPTTQLVLEAEETLLYPGARVLDVGTGSGILAIAAVLLGASQVVAFDVDATAVQNAAENLRNNRVHDRVLLFAGDLHSVRAPERFDLILANIRSAVHRELVEFYREHLRTGGTVVLSGILREEEAGLRDVLQQAGLNVERVREREEWVAIEARALNG